MQRAALDDREPSRPAPDGWATLVDLLVHRFATSDIVPYLFVERADEPPVPMGYADLERACTSVAAHLQRRHDPGDRVLVVLPSGRPFVVGFLGCVLAGVVPVPLPAPGPSRAGRAARQIAKVAAGCRAGGIITTAPTMDVLRAAMGADGDLTKWHDVQEAVRADHRRWVQPPVTADDLAFLQYTSGSTEDPRGVMVSHGNVMADLEIIGEAFGGTPADHGVIWLPPFHDMGLVGGLLAPLQIGMGITCLPPQLFVQAPVRWLRLISDRKATISGGPNFAFDLCLTRIRDDQLEGLDLSSWQLAFVGAEPVLPDTVRRFGERFAPYGFDPAAFYPCYGLAEGTLLITGAQRSGGVRVEAVSRRALDQEGRVAAPTDEVDQRELVSCGRAIGERTTVIVVDPVTCSEVADGTVGEVWVRGPSVAAGYYADPERNAAMFDISTADGRTGFLRTGDLGFVDGGELFVTGRMKDVLVINGRNIDAQDIEDAARSEAEVRRGALTAAFIASDEVGQDVAVVLHEASHRARGDPSSHIASIRGAVARRCGIRLDVVELVPIGRLPRTTSGKLRRREAARSWEADRTAAVDGTGGGAEPCASC